MKRCLQEHTQWESGNGGSSGSGSSGSGSSGGSSSSGGGGINCNTDNTSGNRAHVVFIDS